MNKVTKKFLLDNLKAMYYSYVDQLEKLRASLANLESTTCYSVYDMLENAELAYKEIMRRIKGNKK